MNFIFVLYNNYVDFDRFLGDQAFPIEGDITLYLVDNSITPQEEFLSRWKDLGIVIVRPDRNLGYFGGAQFAFDQAPSRFVDAEFTAIANVDLLFRINHIFHELGKLEVGADVGVLAPCLVGSDGELVEQNHYFIKPARSSYKKLSLIYSFYSLAVAHRLMADAKKYIRRRSRISRRSDFQPIFAPHGAFMIFTRSYVQKTEVFRHPAFLFCEEIFVGGECEKSNLSCLLAPSLTYRHDNHGSIGAIPSRFIVKQLERAHSAVLNYL